MDPTAITLGSNSCVSESDWIDESSNLPYTKAVCIDNSDIHKPLAVRQATRKRRIPQRFRKESDLLPSAQLAAMSMYSEAVTPESTPIPSPQPSPASSQSTSPTFMNHVDLELIDRETVPNQFGLYQRFTEWLSVDPEDDITLNHLADAPTFIGLMEYGHRKAENMFSTVEPSSNPFAPYLNATVYRLMNWFYQTSVKSLTNMDSLVHDMLRAPGFDAIHLENFSALRETKRLDDDLIHPTSDSWQESTVKI